MTSTRPKNVANPKNFAQINAGSARESLTPALTPAFGDPIYKGNVRISQPLGNIQATSAGGHKLQGTVTLQK